MESVIQLQNVSKRYGSQLALDNVSLEVPQGVVFALLGENGAGKSTMIRIMLGLTQADSGKTHVLGLDSNRHGLEIRRSTGYVPESPTLYEWMKVDEIGWFTAGFYAGDFLARYRGLIEHFEVPAKRKIKALSKGMRAKVSLSLAMAHDPGLLVLDEPTSGLDTMVRREFLESMVDLAAKGQTVLLSSHQISEVERVADIVAIVHQGKIVLVEQLDVLKDQIRQLTITLADGCPAPPEITGQVLRTQQRKRQWQVLVRGQSQETLASLRRHAGVMAVEESRPSLEDIFVAYMQKPGPDGESTGGEETSGRKQSYSQETPSR